MKRSTWCSATLDCRPSADCRLQSQRTVRKKETFGFVQEKVVCVCYGERADMLPPVSQLDLELLYFGMEVLGEDG